MGRFDKTYSEQQRTELISLVTEQAWSLTQAADKLEMPRETARKFIAEHLRENPNPLDSKNPIGDMAHRLSLVANQELSILEHVAKNPNNKTRLDLDRAGKLAKLLLDLDKLRKSNAMPAVKDDDNPLAALNATPQSKVETGSVADGHGSGDNQVVASPLAKLAA
jgi:hypothetical protein